MGRCRVDDGIKHWQTSRDFWRDLAVGNVCIIIMNNKVTLGNSESSVEMY